MRRRKSARRYPRRPPAHAHKSHHRQSADFSTLTQVGASYVSTTGQQRHDDMVWRIDIGGRWLWIYTIIEFQSTPNPW
ncbi:hypothetical protein AGMMS49545_14300 [Betaproteobacteria bacterium]|nr:hypothetical protein AGMMS49545_14300 [Betaproteobacteria bacterium]